MFNSISLGVLIVSLMNIPLSIGQTSTTAIRSASTILPSPLTTSLLPSRTPPPTSSQSPDSWQCATKNLTQYFDVPKPSATLLSALQSYGDELNKPCVSTAKGTDVLSCSVSETTKWCAFATAAASTVLPAYSAYGSSAASWYGARSAAIESAMKDCPVTWKKFGQISHAWLNQTIAHAKCYDAAHPKESSAAVPISSATRANSVSRVVSRASSTATK